MIKSHGGFGRMAALATVKTVLLVSAALPPCGVHASPDPPTAEEIIAKATQRATVIRSLTNEIQYLNHRVVVTEELDGKGGVKKRKERNEDVLVVPGSSRTQVVRHCGPKASREEGDLESNRDQEKVWQANRSSGRSREVVLEQELVNRFEFSLAGREIINGRSAFLLHFKPRKDVPEDGIQDRVINRISGRVWIDEADYEIAKVSFGLDNDITFGWGILGELQKFEFVMEQLRMDDGMWLRTWSKGLVEYRKLLASKKVRWQERMTDFQRLERGMNAPISPQED